MQMYALALRTSSSVVSFTVASLMYAHFRDEWWASEDWLPRESEVAGVGGTDFSDSEEGVVTNAVDEGGGESLGRAVYAT